MDIGILTTFSNFNPEFSLTSVVLQQMQMLLKYGHKPILYVLDIFKDFDKVPKGVEVKAVLPQIMLEPYSQRNADNIEKDVAKLLPAMEEHMKDLKVCLTHDIIFINSYLPFNEALRRGIEGQLSHVKWLHWMHSGPSFRNLDGSVWDNLYTLPKNSRLIYMNYTDAIRAAEMYHVLPKDVRTVYNPMDLRYLHKYQDITKELIDNHDLMSADFVAVYPLSTTRMDHAGKQLSKAVWIMAELKKRGKSVRMVVPNAHANADREKKAIENMYNFAHEKGLERRELIFTSLHKPPKYEGGVPHEVVIDLFDLSNLFLFPSFSENCPLILLEAMASKNLLVLNQDFPAFKDFAGHNALYFRFSSTVAPEPQFPDGLDKYYQDVATLIISEFDQNKSLKANTEFRKKFNVDWIWRNQLEPAIMEMIK